jgi:hypothetical protein
MKCDIEVTIHPTGRDPNACETRAYCKSHGVHMDALMAQIEGAMCPLGYVSFVEERFKDEADTIRRELHSFGRTIETFRERLEAMEEKLGIPAPDLDPL